MTEPFSSLRGAVDLGALGSSRPGPSTPAAPPAADGTVGPGGPDGDPGGDPFASPVVVVGDDASFNTLVQRSVSVPAVAVLWTSQAPETQAVLEAVVAVAERREGRLQVVAIDVATNPGIAQAIQPPQLPVSLGLLKGQAIPLFQGLPAQPDLERVLDELLSVAVQQGVTGRIELPGSQGDQADELSPLHEEAYAAIERGDLDAAASAYERALAENPADEDARLGLAQVSLMARTQGVDLQEARAAAAANPTDVDAAIMVADLDVLGGHVEDAFTRLIDVVRATAGEERDRVKAHLLDLFAVVGNQDERVRRGRTSLMSALF
ncbi:tetratricopeptide repeat protein [Janibacter sp. YIM B02568]|uniref:co-chaperone YbbN n=1 Tax=Janibacter endophyticus TaxID=2806261 RepID=UPI001951AE2F|nr:tetratricopeptide repeat protein [Janibacter endophyticus]MBM6545818.1 tetratricopeptide repeat protein [Janibacter endophyticus]